ncbi:hypothetical protein BB560_000419 [Smittium megazygosporum]|uniref:Uncharacterized protein n=1 Tax=Smittium megazygosporum TaxID=133381 RepID=A0A2T9ZKG1_9FUNG|nr:hypothetical protein BB560_000419 [Smittium megazygosporum]
MGDTRKKFKNVDIIGSMLFQRNISGARCVFPGKTQNIDGYQFTNWCQHSSHYFPSSEKDVTNQAENVGLQSQSIPYLNIAVALGFNRRDVTTFLERFSKVLDTLLNN